MSGIVIQTISIIYFAFSAFASIMMIAGGGDGVTLGIILLFIGFVTAMMLYGFGTIIEKLRSIDQTVNDIIDYLIDQKGDDNEST